MYTLSIYCKNVIVKKVNRRYCNKIMYAFIKLNVFFSNTFKSCELVNLCLLLLMIVCAEEYIGDLVLDLSAVLAPLNTS